MDSTGAFLYGLGLISLVGLLVVSGQYHQLQKENQELKLNQASILNYSLKICEYHNNASIRYFYNLSCKKNNKSIETITEFFPTLNDESIFVGTAMPGANCSILQFNYSGR